MNRRQPARFRPAAGLSAGLAAGVVLGAGPARAAGDAEHTWRISVGQGGQGDSWSQQRPGAFSATGRFLAFTSDATNLVPDDTNGVPDVFVRDGWTRTTTRISVGPGGAQGEQGSGTAALSADGRYVVFDSTASTLVGGDTNEAGDVFVRDRLAATTTRVSVATDRGQADGWSQEPSVSATGRYVVFASAAPNLVPGDTNAANDVFRHDRVTGQTLRVSVGSGGAQGDEGSYRANISADGRFVAFVSDASNLVPGDTNAATDVFVRDLGAGSTSRVSVASDGAEGAFTSTDPVISAGGRFVAFTSDADNLVTGDTNLTNDIFLRDRWTGATSRVNVATGGEQANTFSQAAGSVSWTGRFVTFTSAASNLVPGDTNGTEEEGEFVPAADVFLRDRREGTTTRVSVASDGTQAGHGGWNGALSPDGQLVAFTSADPGLVSGDTNGSDDVFVRRRP
jgi:Tol biopolymer transport system component